jgi:hypothetical protein
MNAIRQSLMRNDEERRSGRNQTMDGIESSIIDDVERKQLI